jgi:hypothetical protein
LENWISSFRKPKLDPCLSPVQISIWSGLRTLTQDLKLCN